MPLTTIVNIRKKSSKIDIWCKDLFIAKFRFPPNTKCLNTFNDALLKAQPMTIDRLFAFCVPRGADQEHYWDLYSVMSEMKVHTDTQTDTNTDTHPPTYTSTHRRTITTHDTCIHAPNPRSLLTPCSA